MPLMLFIIYFFAFRHAKIDADFEMLR